MNREATKIMERASDKKPVRGLKTVQATATVRKYIVRATTIAKMIQARHAELTAEYVE